LDPRARILIVFDPDRGRAVVVVGVAFDDRARRVGQRDDVVQVVLKVVTNGGRGGVMRSRGFSVLTRKRGRRAQGHHQPQ
jgi:hypothetical protein